MDAEERADALGTPGGPMLGPFDRAERGTAPGAGGGTRSLGLATGRRGHP